MNHVRSLAFFSPSLSCACACVFALAACDPDHIYKAPTLDGGTTHVMVVDPDSGRSDDVDAGEDTDARVRADGGGSADVTFVPIQTDDTHMLHAMLIWNPLLQVDETDVDLHLMHPEGTEWELSPFDCFYSNLTPTWDENRVYSATLVRDVLTGHGPEDIYISTIPQSEYGRSYRVAVHFFSSHGQAGPAQAYVYVSCHGVTTQFGPVLLFNDDIWRVADVSFGPNSCGIQPLGAITHFGETGYLAR